MKIYLLFFALFTNYLFAQNEVDSASYYYEKGFFGKGIKYCELLKKDLEEKNEANSNDYIVNANNLAIFYEFDEKFDKSELNYLLSIKLRKKTNENSLEYINSLQQIGLFYKKIGNESNYEKYLLEEVNIMKKYFGTNNLEYLKTLFVVVKFYISNRKFSQAEKYVIEK